MFSVMLASSLLVTSPVSYDETVFDYETNSYYDEMSLSDKERQRIHRECAFAINKMYACLDRANREASMITDINIRDCTQAAIEGAICGLAGRNVYSVVIGGCLGTMAHIGGNGYRHFHRSRDHVHQAEKYALIADELQERLWRDE